MAQVDFDDENDELARTRLRMTDPHTERASVMTRRATFYSAMASFPIPARLQRRRRNHAAG